MVSVRGSAGRGRHWFIWCEFLSARATPSSWTCGWLGNRLDDDSSHHIQGHIRV